MLAAHEEQYLLEVTDFSTLGDLLHFMAQLVSDHPDGTSPIANQIHIRFGPRIRDPRTSAAELPERSSARLLNVRCSAKTLGYLYAFDEYTTGLDARLRERVDPVSGLCAQQFIDLSRMLRHACENPQVNASLGEQLDIGALHRCHHAALAQQAELRAQFSRFSLNKSWETECVV
jgi:hypothetical protein